MVTFSKASSKTRFISHLLVMQTKTLTNTTQNAREIYKTLEAPLATRLVNKLKIVRNTLL